MSIPGVYNADNIFKKILNNEAPNIKVFEDDMALAFMDIFPESDGHVLVVPKVEARNFLDLPKEWVGPYMERVQKITLAVHAALKPDGIKVMQYNGAVATQTVFHVHFHIVPCYEGVELREHANVPANKEDLESFAALIRAALKNFEE